MAAAELAFEYLALALEATRGTAITPPTHYLPLAGTLTPETEFYRPDESRGTLAEYYRAAAVRKYSNWQAEGGADPNYAPLLFNMALKPVTSPTTPASAILSRLWTFVPTMNADDLKSGTVYFGDPNNQIWQGAFGMVDDLEIDSDASGTDAATMSISGMTQFAAKVTAPALPAQSVGSLLIPGAMQVWIDTASAIGTTAVTGRVVSANFKVSNNLAYKYLAAGPGASLSYQRIGRGKRHAESTVVFELADQTQYDIWAAGTTVKMRVRLNGDLIETVAGPLSFYNYIEWDIYGPFDSFDWGDLEGTNRTISLTVMSQYDSTLGADYALRVQNQKATL